ncbi:DUF6415 family natural product biosynthesis protein [Streptomyces gardneri]|uniref:DUF6415 family natural product biosynthesis protein n=1 Tax=Streptomyces gardneri TaxID=66892 RepID=UPI00367B75F5
MSHGTVVHDPTGTIAADIPLDRDRLQEVAAAVLGWGQGGSTPPPPDIELAALQLAGYTHLLVSEVHEALQHLAAGHPARLRATVTCDEAVRRLRPPAFRRPGGSLGRAQNQARLVQALHTALDDARHHVNGAHPPAWAQHPYKRVGDSVGTIADRTRSEMPLAPPSFGVL